MDSRSPGGRAPGAAAMTDLHGGRGPGHRLPRHQRDGDAVTDLGPLRLRPWTVKAAKPWVAAVHRRLPRVQGALWAVSVRRGVEVVGCALVGNAARVWMEDGVLAVLRVAVLEGNPNACSMLYGSCSRAARAMGADDLVTYTELDEPGTTLRASGWIDGGLTSGGEWGRPSRARATAVSAARKRRWFAPWGKRAQALAMAAAS